MKERRFTLDKTHFIALYCLCKNEKDDDEDSKTSCEIQSEPELVQAGMSNGYLKITSKLQPEICAQTAESKH